MAKEKDTQTKAFMERPEVFADAFNFLIYGGKQVIQPDELREMDTTVIGAPYGSDGARVPVQKIRDVFKSWSVKRDNNAAYLLLGVENQSDIHYAMPVRNMVYDALQYSAQVDEAAKSHRKENPKEKVSSGEFLSGFYETDKLIPVITLVIYFGANKWTAPTSLHEMMAVKDEAILRFAADYKINLVTPEALAKEDQTKFCSDLKEVLFFVKWSQDKEKLREFINSDAKFEAMDRDTAGVIKAVTGFDIKMNESEEKVNMCKAIEDIRIEGREEGIIGTVDILRSIGISDDDIVNKIANRFSLSEEDAERYVYGEEG